MMFCTVIHANIWADAYSILSIISVVIILTRFTEVSWMLSANPNYPTTCFAHNVQ